MWLLTTQLCVKH